MNPESVRRGLTPQNSLLVKAVPECMRSKAPPPPEKTLMQQTATWPDPPKDQPAEVEEMEVEDANPPWNARERAFIAKMERYFENSERIQGISEMEHFLLSPGTGGPDLGDRKGDACGRGQVTLEWKGMEA